MCELEKIAIYDTGSIEDDRKKYHYRQLLLLVVSLGILWFNWKILISKVLATLSKNELDRLKSSCWTGWGNERLNFF